MNRHNEENVTRFFDQLDQIEQRHLEGVSCNKLAIEYNVSRGFVQKHLRHLKESTTESRIKALLENERIKLLTMRW